MERKEVPAGIIVFVIFIIALNIFSLSYYGYYQMIIQGSLQTFLTPSLVSIIVWIDVVLAVLSLLIIPYGFIKRRQGARTYALVFLAWSALGALASIIMTGEKLIRFPLLVLYVALLAYLLMSSVKRYFSTSTPAVVTADITKEYTYGDYTLYSKLVRLKNRKTQLIYYFSKRKPKSGTPASFPYGYEVQTSKRSGLPYLRRNESSPPMVT